MKRARPADEPAEAAFAAAMKAPVAPATPRRLVVRDAGYGELHLSCAPHDQIDLTGIEHASTANPVVAVVQEKCSLGCWHDLSTTALECWGRA